MRVVQQLFQGLGFGVEGTSDCKVSAISLDLEFLGL